MSASPQGERPRRRRGPLGALLWASLASGCGGPPPAQPPAPAPTPAPKPTPAQSLRPQPGPSPTPAPKPKPKPKPAPRLRVQLVGAQGSRLVAGETRLSLPATLRFAAQRKGSQALRGRLSLNTLSQALAIPSSARERLEGDAEGIWLRVKGSCAVTAGPATTIRLELGDEILGKLVRGDEVILSDASGRVQLSLSPEAPPAR